MQCTQTTMYIGAIAVRGGTFGQGRGPIHLDNLDCNGQEIRLPTCQRRSNCGHDEDAGVICSGAINTGD